MENGNKDIEKVDIEKAFSKIEEAQEALVEEAKAFLTVSSKIHTMDLFTCSIINRAVSLIKGFLLLSKENNYISSVPIIRMQIDNCLRFYATTLVADYNDLYLKFLDGEHIGNIQDIDGERMTDNYLVKKLNKLYPGIHDLYKSTSGFVHFSNEHSAINTKVDPIGEKKINFGIGDLDYFENDQKLDFAYNMFRASRVLLALVRSWKPQKLNVEMVIANGNKI